MSVGEGGAARKRAMRLPGGVRVGEMVDAGAGAGAGVGEWELGCSSTVVPEVVNGVWEE